MCHFDVSSVFQKVWQTRKISLICLISFCCKLFWIEHIIDNDPCSWFWWHQWKWFDRKITIPTILSMTCKVLTVRFSIKTFKRWPSLSNHIWKLSFLKSTLARLLLLFTVTLINIFTPKVAKCALRGWKHLWVWVCLVLVCVSEAGPLLSKNFIQSRCFYLIIDLAYNIDKKGSLKIIAIFCKNSVQMFWNTCSTITHYNNNISCKIRSNRCTMINNCILTNRFYLKT